MAATGLSPAVAEPMVFGLEHAYGPAWQQDYGTLAGRTLTGATPAEAFPDVTTPERQQYRDALVHILSPGQRGADHPDVQLALRGALADGMTQADRDVVAQAARTAADERNPDASLGRTLDIPRDQLIAWQALAMKQMPQSVLDRMDAMNGSIMSTFQTRLSGPHDVPFPNTWGPLNVREATGVEVNMDYYAVTVQLPPGTNPAVLLNTIRKDLNGLVNTDKSMFTPYPNQSGGGDNVGRWNGNDRTTDHPTGSFVHIDIPIVVVGGVRIPGNHGTVAVIDSASDHWTFATVQSPVDGQHPVSGNRQFGYTDNGHGSYTFYTRGVDRLTDVGMRVVNGATGGAVEGGRPGVAFAGADALWRSFQHGIAEHVESLGGTATVERPVIRRPDWNAVEAVLEGKEGVDTFMTRQSRHR